jgi:PKD repeat protein
LEVNFAANASDSDGTIRDYQWTFDDGTFSTNANPRKIFPAPGTYHARLTVTDSSGNTCSGVVIINAQASFELWRQAKFLANELGNSNISGAMADPDLDGVNNRLEYLLGLEPKVRNTATNGLPRAAISDGVFTLTYTRLKAASDLTLGVESSPDLQTWTPATPARVVDNGLFETITIEQNLSSAADGFFRFTVH